MRPRLDLIKPFNRLSLATSPSPSASFLLPFVQQQRSASILSSLSDNPGAYNKRKRLGRGPASGKGKTAGRGQKGQKAHGKVPAGFNGGQTPDEIVNPIRGRGAVNHFALDLARLNVDRLQDWIDQGRLDSSRTITVKELVKSGCVTRVTDGIKLLARGADQLRTPVDIIVSRASATAINAIENAGGSIQTRFYTADSIRRVIKGEADPVISLQSPPADDATEAQRIEYPYRLPDATSRKDIEYYRDAAHRGYLSYQVDQGKGPSLFHKTAEDMRKGRKKVTKKKATTEATENRIW